MAEEFGSMARDALAGVNEGESVSDGASLVITSSMERQESHYTAKGLFKDS